MRRNPKVSIVIPVFNGADYLAEAIDSALAQTYKNIEIVVVNDGSQDGGKTEQIARSYGNKIKYFSKENGGVASALNSSLKYLTGDYFSWLSHDDIYLPDKIDKQIGILSRPDHSRSIVYSDYIIFSNSSNVQTTIRLRAPSPEAFRYWITTENSLHGCTLLIPMIAFGECGVFDEQLRTTQDYDLWFRMATRFNFVHIPQITVMSRQHAAQGSVAMADIALDECNVLLSTFVKELTKSEIEEASKLSLTVAYAIIASSMWRRGFLTSGKVAASLSLHNFKDNRLVNNIEALYILARGFFLTHLMRTIKGIVPSRLRAFVGNLFGVSRNVRRGADLKDKFSEVYKKNLFKGRKSRSGEGSDLVQTATIREALPQLVNDFEINSLLDGPCGDWYWMRELNLRVDHYIGVDIVEELIRKNQSEFGKEGVSFQYCNLAVDKLPAVDLIFCRDCLVHLSFEDATRVVANFKRSGAKFLLTTTFTGRMTNEDLGNGFWRPLNLQLAPFNFPCPLRLINENCTEQNGMFSDKSLGLWLLNDIDIE